MNQEQTHLYKAFVQQRSEFLFEGDVPNEDDWEVYYLKYPILSTTKYGVWIDCYGKKKFVNLTCRKTFAYKTVEEALEGYIKRTEVYIKILKSNLYVAEGGLKHAKKVQGKLV